VPYPVACRPQAWAAGAIPYLLLACLGLEADGPNRRLHVRRPTLPRGTRSLTLRGLAVAGARVDLRFERDAAGAVALAGADVSGDLEVTADP
jgi:glycogen debranching enzyme